jgi:DNA polymerase-3 subunit epsilon
MAFLVLDLEMTGTMPGWHEIIQIGAVLYDDNWHELGKYESLVYPENEESFSAPAEEVHGISIYDLDEAPMQHEVLPEMEKWILNKLGIHKGGFRELQKVVICGQSVINDINFLKFAYEKEKMRWPFSRKLIDLHTLSYFCFRILEANGQSTPRRLSLDAVSEFFGFSRDGDQHNALEDAILTAKCLKEFFKIADTLKVNEA